MWALVLSGSDRTEEERSRARYDPDLHVFAVGWSTLLLVWAAGYRVAGAFTDPTLTKNEILWYPLVALPEMLQIIAWTIPGGWECGCECWGS